MDVEKLIADLTALRAIEKALSRAARTQSAGQVHAENVDTLDDAITYIKHAEDRVKRALDAGRRGGRDTN